MWEALRQIRSNEGIANSVDGVKREGEGAGEEEGKGERKQVEEGKGDSPPGDSPPSAHRPQESAGFCLRTALLIQPS